MNYYIIPKNNFRVKLGLKLTSETITPYISHSLIFYINDTFNQMCRLDNIDDIESKMTLKHICKFVNPFEFIHSNVPGSTISVSKVKANSTIFYELMELFQILNINDLLLVKHKMNIVHLTPNYTSTNYLLNMLREDNEDNIFSSHFYYDKLYDKFIKTPYEHKLDLIICEFAQSDYADTNKYINNIILIMLIIVKYQMKQGISVIKLENIFYKPIIDIIFILSSLYERVYLIKSSISDITKGERYLICKGFDDTINIDNIEGELISKLNNSELMENKNISSIIDNELPCYLLNKLEETNLINAQQQLEAYDQIINIFKNKNREEKVEHLKRSHIQKCIQWCEKNQLPHNKFMEKVNMFLTPKKKLQDDNRLQDDNIILQI